jgi:1-acyl-sn-glycerol-3-phosphate acyltransferase
MVRPILSPLLTVVAILSLGLSTLILGSYLIVLLRIVPRTRQVTPVMRLWARLFLLTTGTRVTVEGLDHLDPTASYVFTGNHISNIDIPVMIGRLPVSVRFLAKKELFAVPVLGGAMRAIHIVRTDRKAGTIAHREINEQVGRVIAAGLSLVIYPEGTRSRDAELMPFKKGAFRIAIDNGMPIVPVTITGSERVWKPGSKLIRGGPVRLVIHEPISTVGLTQNDIGDLRDRVREIVAERYAAIRAR